MKKVLALGVISALALGLTACSDELSGAEADACDAVHAWYTGGHLPDDFTRFVTRAQEALGASDNNTLNAAVTRLANSADTARVTAAETLIAQCRDLGWEPPEG